jgi:hypothetical protein
MTFKPEPNLPNDPADPAKRPAVRIFFIGQMILESSADGKTCEVFINRAAPGHHLSIEVRRKQPGKPDQIMMRHLGSLPFASAPTGVTPKHGLFINVTNGPQGVKGYSGSVASTEGKALARAFNMRKIHDVEPGRVDPIGGRPSILIDDAVFYAADTITKCNLKKKQDNSSDLPQTEKASIIGANIYLPADNSKKVTLTWRQGGMDVQLKLERSDVFSYEIYINNEPLYEDDNDPFKHDEFSEFYRILRDIPREEQFELTFPAPDPVAPPPSRGTTRTPCMSVLLDI